MTYTDEHAAGMIELQAELGDACPTIAWFKVKTAPETIKVLPGSISLKSANSVGGISLDSDFSCVCLAADFSSLPSTNQNINYLGKRLSIEAVMILPGGKLLRLKANDAAQGL